MHKSYKYRIYPTPDQKLKIDQTIGACRYIYNLALEKL
jgi:transposase